MNRRQPLVKKPGDPALAARSAALHALYAILHKGITLEEALRQEAINGLEPRDKGLVRQLLMLSLKRRGEALGLLRGRLENPDKKLPVLVEEIFILGIVQLLWLNIPDHAAVDTSVTLAKLNRAQQHAGLVNAVLKRIARDHKDLPSAPLTNLPEWLRQQLITDYGESTALEIAAAHIPEAPLDITLKTDANPFSDGTLLSTGTIRLKEHDVIPRMEGFADGMWWVQDAAAALPVKLLGEVQGKTIVDLCAAPGGKTLQLAAAGANVIAVDRSASRMQRVEDNLLRTQLSAECVVQDAKLFSPSYTIDGILLDAPCSATGTLRRNPDVAWHRQPEDIEKLSGLQHALLVHAAELLRPGGKLVYCVCSLLPQEGEAVIARFLKEYRHFSVAPASAEALGIPQAWIAKEGAVRTLPHYWAELGGMDGFFMVCLIRR